MKKVSTLSKSDTISLTFNATEQYLFQMKVNRRLAWTAEPHETRVNNLSYRGAWHLTRYSWLMMMKHPEKQLQKYKRKQIHNESLSITPCSTEIQCTLVSLVSVTSVVSDFILARAGMDIILHAYILVTIVNYVLNIRNYKRHPM